VSGNGAGPAATAARAASEPLPRLPSPGEASASPEPALALREALALGVLHGPAELLPISSSGHVALVPWLCGWSYPRLDAELRKGFEVALHAGTAAALLLGLRDEVAEAVSGLDRRRLQLIVLSFAPAGALAFLLERPIERRLGTPGTVAAGLAVGALAMAWADRAPQRRLREEATARDALALGIAQACALVPGVSRNGATLAAARARGFTREDANALSRHAALPIILAATALKGVRLRRRGLPRRTRAAFALGTAASFASTLASTWLIRQVERDRSLAPYAAYRLALAAVVGRRLRRTA
jgi:undecaprenyl-diphosphatase